MDTRTKIVTVEEIAATARNSAADVALVSGIFGVLDASTVAELAAVKQGRSPILLVVAVLDAPSAVLPARARAELAAALAVVDYVVIPGGSAALEALVATLAPVAVMRCEQAHQERMRRLIDHVH